MRDPKRILEKILGNGQNLDQFEQTGEPLEQLVNFLRDVVKCRRTRQWIADNYGIDMAVSPETFSLLLDIPQINFIENSNRLLEVESISLRETRNPDDRTVAAMDVLFPRLGEIVGGSQREEDGDQLLQLMRKKGLSEEIYQWYLELRRFGTAPHSGFGLGLERLVQFVTGMKNIRDVIPFPRVPGNARF